MPAYCTFSRDIVSDLFCLTMSSLMTIALLSPFAYGQGMPLDAGGMYSARLEVAHRPEVQPRHTPMRAACSLALS